MAKTVGVGIQSFSKIIEGNYYYIDKTMFIKDWWENGDDVTLITRPRRFGKTLNISMLEQFFSVEYAGRGDLFEGLSIWQEEKYQKLQGTYPVISLSFARVKESNYEYTLRRILELLMVQFEQHSYLAESDKLSDYEKDYVQRMRADMNAFDAGSSLHRLSELLYKHHGQKVIILLDEYDTPMQEAYIHGFWEEMVGLTRSLFNSTFKTNPSLARGMMTGITRVSKESVFSDLNHLEVVTTTSDKYATSFGFTEEEVFAALDECGYGNEKEEVKRWYDGFVFGKHQDIYNPWSILNFLAKGKYETYWANTSSNGLVSKLIREGSHRIKQDFEELLKGEHLRCPIDEQVVYDQLDHSESAIWSLLLAAGYLKAVSYDRMELLEEGVKARYELALTNYEVRLMFEGMIYGWFAETEADYNDFVEALLKGDLKAMNGYMNRVCAQCFSYFDTGKRASGAQPERFYHGFVLGLLVELRNRYSVTSNRESGFGRYDVMIEPKDKKDNAFILEFKVYDSDKEGDLKDTVQAALNQIEERQYDSALIANGVAKERIHKYGFAFKGKEVLIGKLQ